MYDFTIVLNDRGNFTIVLDVDFYFLDDLTRVLDDSGQVYDDLRRFGDLFIEIRLNDIATVHPLTFIRNRFIRNVPDSQIWAPL